jgi:hypothetical protein
MTAGFGFTGTAPYTYAHTVGRKIPKTSFATEVASIRSDAASRYGRDIDKP